MSEIDAPTPSPSSEPTVLLCASCAAEAGFADDAHATGLISGEVSVGCEHCGATLTGFGYVAPQSAYSGMAPGAG